MSNKSESEGVKFIKVIFSTPVLTVKNLHTILRCDFCLF